MEILNLTDIEYDGKFGEKVAENERFGGKLTEEAAARWGLVYFSLTAITSCLSLIGCSIIMAAYCLQKPPRRTTFTLLVYVTVADFLTAFGNFLGIIWWLAIKNNHQLPLRDFYCDFHSGLTIFSSIASYMWTAFTAIYLHLMVVKGKCVLTCRRRVIIHAICWGIPAVVLGLTLVFGVLGEDVNTRHASWCWIRNDVITGSVLFWQYVTGKAWEMMSLVLTFLVYSMTRCHLYKQLLQTKYLFAMSTENQGRTNTIVSANRRMTFVPVVFLVCRIWGTIRFILGQYAPVYANSAASVWIVPLQGVGDSAQGFANCVLLFCLTPSLRRHFFSRLFSCSRRQPDVSVTRCRDPHDTAMKSFTTSRDTHHIAYNVSMARTHDYVYGTPRSAPDCVSNPDVSTAHDRKCPNSHGAPRERLKLLV